MAGVSNGWHFCTTPVLLILQELSWILHVPLRSNGPLTPEQNLPDQCVKDTALGYMVHCYCQLTEKNIPITDWAPSASLLTLPGFARAQKADLSLERQCAREGLSRDSICLQEGKGNTSMSRAEKTLASVLCSALGPSECVIFPWPQR